MGSEKILDYLRRRTSVDEELAAADLIERQAAQIDALTRELTKIMIEGGESAMARAERKLRC